MNKIDSFEQACELLGISTELPEVSKLPQKHQDAIIANYKLIIIIEATNKINGNWQPNWNDWDQYKYYPWFEVDADEDRPSGFGFSCSLYGYSLTLTHVGSRLCVGSREQALYLATQFEHLYKQMLLLVL